MKLNLSVKRQDKINRKISEDFAQISKVARLNKKPTKEKSLRLLYMNRTEFAMMLNDIDTSFLNATHLKYTGLSVVGNQLRGDT